MKDEAEILVWTQSGEEPVLKRVQVAARAGDFIVHKSSYATTGPLLWAVTHVPSRLAVCWDFGTKAAAVAAMNRIVAEMPRWKFRTKAGATKWAMANRPLYNRLRQIIGEA